MGARPFLAWWGMNNGKGNSKGNGNVKGKATAFGLRGGGSGREAGFSAPAATPLSVEMMGFYNRYSRALPVGFGLSEKAHLPVVWRVGLCCGFWQVLEDELAAQLQLSLFTCGTADRPKTASIIQVAVGCAHGWMVEQVERFKPELESSFTPYRELAED